MIGNDIVDLALARTESNWQRKGLLNKIFTENEIKLIYNSNNQEVTIWNLWSRKEAVYKIYNRETGFRKFNPMSFECIDLDKKIGKVIAENITYHTKTEITTELIYTIAVINSEDLDKIIILENNITIEKQDGIPFYVNNINQIVPISKSHHGRFERIISINSESRFKF